MCKKRVGPYLFIYLYICFSRRKQKTSQKSQDKMISSPRRMKNHGETGTAFLALHPRRLFDLGYPVPEPGSLPIEIALAKEPGSLFGTLNRRASRWCLLVSKAKKIYIRASFRNKMKRNLHLLIYFFVVLFSSSIP